MTDFIFIDATNLSSKPITLLSVKQLKVSDVTMLDKTLNVFQVREMEMANHCQFRASWRFSEWNYGLVFHHDISQDISNGRNKYSI